MRLYVVQHGEALPKEQDPDRPLSEAGRRDVGRVGRVLAAAGAHPARVLHSGKERARQTAEMLATAVGATAAPEARDGLSPNDPVAPLAEQAAGWQEDIVIAGHQPFVGRLAAMLLTGREDGAALAFTPGSAVCLERAEDGTWALAWMLRPELAAGQAG